MSGGQRCVLSALAEALISMVSLGSQGEFVVGEYVHVNWTDPPEFPGHAARDQPRNPGPAARVQGYQACVMLDGDLYDPCRRTRMCAHHAVVPHPSPASVGDCLPQV